MSKAIAPAATSRVGLTNTLAALGTFGAAFFFGTAMLQLAVPAQAGGQIVNPNLFQIERGFDAVIFAGMALICAAFYYSGAAGRGSLAKVGLGLAMAGGIAMSSDSVMRAVSGQNAGSPFWMILFFLGLYFFAPVLLGVAALHARLVPQQQALYPILSVLLLVVAGFLPTGSAGPLLTIIFHGVAWTGFGVLALMVKPGMTPALEPTVTRKRLSRESK